MVNEISANYLNSLLEKVDREEKEKWKYVLLSNSVLYVCVVDFLLRPIYCAISFV